jgi:hypothetical protein
MQCLYQWKLFVDIMEFEREAVANGQDPNAPAIETSINITTPSGGQSRVFVMKVHPRLAGGPRSEPEP